MMIPFLTSLIIDRCLGYLLDPISTILELSTKYNLHPGQFIKRICIRNLGTNGATVITITDITYVGIDAEGYILAITSDSRFTSTTRMPNYDSAAIAMCVISREIDGKMIVFQDGKKIIIPSTKMSEDDTEIGIGIGEITYLELG